MFRILLRAHSHLPGLSDRVSMRTLLFTAFEYIFAIIARNGVFCQHLKDKLSFAALARQRPKPSPLGKVARRRRDGRGIAAVRIRRQL